GMSLQEERDLADAKEALGAQLQSVQQQMLNAMQSFNQQAPQASTELQRANENLTQAELQQAITDAALYIDAGYGLYIAGNESAVTSGLQNLSQALERAQRLAQSANAPGNSDLDRARAQAQSLRSQLQQLAQGGDPNQQGQNQNGQQPG